LIFVGGLALLVAGGFIPNGTYAQSVAVEVGATALLVVPIVLAERAIVGTMRRRMDDALAITRTDEFVRVDNMLAQFGQTIGSKTRLPSTLPGQLSQMLELDDWSRVKVSDGHQLWNKGDLIFAVPLGKGPVSRGVLLGAMRYAGWTFEHAAELWNRTRPEGRPAFELPAQD
jgi:hypothetical protein